MATEAKRPRQASAPSSGLVRASASYLADVCQSGLFDVELVLPPSTFAWRHGERVGDARGGRLDARALLVGRKHTGLSASRGSSLPSSSRGRGCSSRGCDLLSAARLCDARDPCQPLRCSHNVLACHFRKLTQVAGTWPINTCVWLGCASFTKHIASSSASACAPASPWRLPVVGPPHRRSCPPFPPRTGRPSPNLAETPLPVCTLPHPWSGPWAGRHCRHRHQWPPPKCGRGSRRPPPPRAAVAVAPPPR